MEQKTKIIMIAAAIAICAIGACGVVCELLCNADIISVSTRFNAMEILKYLSFASAGTICISVTKLVLAEH